MTRGRKKDIMFIFRFHHLKCIDIPSYIVICGAILGSILENTDTKGKMKGGWK